MSDIQIQSTTPEQQATYLSAFVAKSIVHKVRLEYLLKKYQEQYRQISEDIIDQTDLIESLQG